MDNLGNDIVSYTILVTGSTGYLGKCIVKKIKQEDIQVISIARGSKNKNIEACDLTKKNEIKEKQEELTKQKTQEEQKKKKEKRKIKKTIY